MRKKLKTYFPGDFNPPDKYDLNIAKWLSKKSLDVSEVVIVLGKEKDGELPQEVKEEIWKIYLSNNSAAPISIVKSKNLSPLSYIYKEQEGNTALPFAIALQEGISDDERFTSYFDIFPNCEIIITPPHKKDDVKSLAQDGDVRKFNAVIPTELSKEDKNKVLELLKTSEPDPVDEVLTKEYWKNSVSNLLEKAGIKNNK